MPTHRIREAIRGVCAKGLYAQGHHDYVGVKVTSFDPDDRSFDLEIRLLAGERYCCAEPGCHFDGFGPAWWKKLRAEIDGAGIDVPRPLRLRKVVVVIEDGAMLGLREPGDDRPLRSSTGFEYSVDGTSEPGA